MKKIILKSTLVVATLIMTCYAGTETYLRNKTEASDMSGILLQNVEALAQETSDEEQPTKTIKVFSKIYKCVPKDKPKNPLNVVGYAADCTPFETPDLSRKDECKESIQCPSGCNTYE